MPTGKQHTKIQWVGPQYYDVRTFKGDNDDPDILYYRPCLADAPNSQYIAGTADFDEIEEMMNVSSTFTIYDVPAHARNRINWCGANWYRHTQIISERGKPDVHLFEVCNEKEFGAQYLKQVPSALIIEVVDVLAIPDPVFSMQKLIAHLQVLNPDWEIVHLGDYLIAYDKEEGELYFRHVDEYDRSDWAIAQNEHDQIIVSFRQIIDPVIKRRSLVGARELPDAPPDPSLGVPHIIGSDEEPPAEAWGPTEETRKHLSPDNKYFSGECHRCRKMTLVLEEKQKNAPPNASPILGNLCEDCIKKLPESMKSEEDSK
jgi:hypothetical protein